MTGGIARGARHSIRDEISILPVHLRTDEHAVEKSVVSL